MKKDIEIYEAVMRCESHEELAEVIEQIGEQNGGLIPGTTKVFSAKLMAANCRIFDSVPANALTRNYGIREKAIYIQINNK